MNFSLSMLKQMREEGLDFDAAIRVLEAGVEQRSSAAERQARYRERKRNERDVTRDVTPAPNERDNLTPTREEKPSPKGEVKKIERGSRLPADWEPEPLTGKAAAMVALWNPGELERELAKFKNYWPSKGANAARTDWQRTWVNWLISADERKPRRNERPDEEPTAAALRRIIGPDFGAHAGTG
jgi:hypothetical protein